MIRCIGMTGRRLASVCIHGLDGRSVVARFGTGIAQRLQQLRFDTIDDARAAYFSRLADLSAKGFLDATQD